MSAISRELRRLSLEGCRTFTTSSKRGADFTHTIIGGGVVGLAIARQLAYREKSSTLLIERNQAVGLETSSRNSEQIIHAGLYYGTDSLKTHLCVRGKRYLYSLCSKYCIPYAKPGKWIVAQTEKQFEELIKLHQLSSSIDDNPTEFVSEERARREEPFVQAKAGILESSTTGIIDSHAFMQFLVGDFQDKGGQVALHSSVVHVESLGTRGSQGWTVTVRDTRSGEYCEVTSETLINAAGLGACEINNMVLPQSEKRQQYYAKGNYFTCTRTPSYTSHLIYPAPEPGLGGLGTHLTLDMGGRMRFGPDVEWVDSPNNLEVNISRLPQAIEQIKRFLPSLDEETLVPDYAGIRPKLANNAAVGSGKNFVDFYVQKEANWNGFVNLLGIESPGLTSSLAIAEMVEDLLYN
ncbi:L-2-hydroxyglutarate dehydrogenase, mitochondrial [Golovinomyces cichoracearum]|uniref:L-2-hydroxyglutarate dehydrogenase, mitochondrial n=1 Tax=Golovinomyces cichoracearum TaxID=62708 RepID=A0A420J0H2_9PEZI|nr:L-2-hydroxyglutarate dehydrogenase, mitochondrial [Golovinomyces cichoracearum]